MKEKIEILPVSLLESERHTVRQLRELAGKLKLEFGWHYLLDLSWILSQIEAIQEKRFIDAGAGTGILQWFLAERGAKVISIDRESRADLAPRFRRRFNVCGLRMDDLNDGKSGLEEKPNLNYQSIKLWASDLQDRIENQLDEKRSRPAAANSGEVIIYNQDLTNLVDIDDSTVDAVVAVSSLEHNSPGDLRQVVKELMRVLKPGGALLATLAAAREEDWFHQPSRGWCYSEGSLREIFKFSPKMPSNYSRYDRLFEQLRANEELKNNLADFYSRSGDNGMPWGKWDPQYQPVGVCKIKQETVLGEL